MMRVLTRVHRAVLTRLPAEWRAGVSVVASVDIDPDVLTDEPRLRTVLSGDLVAKVAAAKPPRWRAQDAWLHLVNAARALRGETPLSPWWDERLDVSAQVDDPDLFEQHRYRLTARALRSPVSARPRVRALLR